MTTIKIKINYTICGLRSPEVCGPVFNETHPCSNSFPSTQLLYESVKYQCCIYFQKCLVISSIMYVHYRCAFLQYALMLRGVTVITNAVWAQNCETESHAENLEYPPDFFEDTKNIVLDVPIFVCHVPETYRVSQENSRVSRFPKKSPTPGRPVLFSRNRSCQSCHSPLKLAHEYFLIFANCPFLEVWMPFQLLFHSQQFEI